MTKQEIIFNKIIETIDFENFIDPDIEKEKLINKYTFNQISEIIQFIEGLKQKIEDSLCAYCDSIETPEDLFDEDFYNFLDEIITNPINIIDKYIENPKLIYDLYINWEGEYSRIADFLPSREDYLIGGKASP